MWKGSNTLDQGIGPPTLKTWLRPWFCGVEDMPKCVSGHGSAPDPAGSSRPGRLLHISNEAACFIRKLRGLKSDAVFDSCGEYYARTLQRHRSTQHMSVLRLFKFFLLVEV